MDEARRIMKEHPAGVDNFEPLFRYKEFADSSINFYLILRAKKYIDHFGMKSQFIKNLHQRFNKEGIVIPFPIRTVHLIQEKNS